MQSYANLVVVALVLVVSRMTRAQYCDITDNYAWTVATSYLPQAENVAGYQDCCTLCINNNECTCWSYEKNRKTCFLQVGCTALSSFQMTYYAAGSVVRPLPSPSPSPSGTQSSDPIIKGFDGSVFNFNEVGEHIMIEEAEGWMVRATFAGEEALDKGTILMETSWTSSIRVFSPNGDMVACALPAIRPNTSRVQGIATPFDPHKNTVLLSPSTPRVLMDQVSATAVLSEASPQQVTGCRITTPKFEVVVYQVSGWEQASLHPETEAWAAPFTWLNAEVKISKPLAHPVTGYLGATYPMDEVAQEIFLRSQSGKGSNASIGDEVVGRGLAESGGTPFFLVSGIVGVGHHASEPLK